ncbi:hypothetical protein [Streptomyces scopuliridis]|uniref:hypothetical protein n=1 Tax=Streptomyces scopuliridis TaxID=452529 RepID=UPI0036B57C3B
MLQLHRRPRRDRHRPPRPQDIDQTDADAVGEGTLTPLWTYDTTTDSGPHDVELCATEAGWLPGAYAGQVRAHRPRSVPGAQWREWAGHRARTTVAVKKTADAAKPPDTGTEACRQWTVTATPEEERTVDGLSPAARPGPYGGPADGCAQAAARCPSGFLTTWPSGLSATPMSRRRARIA